ncbi:hypothetical protein [Rugosimonospora acidiphila]|uniref:hypothetical protein n=1 Tax=Rugosimonospora acidiphila TaxID=556531 RepID=UPI0031E5DA05
MLGAHPQAGASGVALALADAAAVAGLRVLLIDSADPARSGLAGVCAVEGRSVPGAHGRSAMRIGTRTVQNSRLAVRRLVGTGTPITIAQLPLPTSWASAEPSDFDLTIVDVGWDVWPLTIPGESLGPLLWCTGSPTCTFPVVVMRSTVGSVGLAEGMLTRYDTGVRQRGFVEMGCAVAVGGESWPTVVRAVMGLQLESLSERTLFISPSPEAATAGWSVAPVPANSVRTAMALLQGVGGPIGEALAPQQHNRKARRFGRS